MMGKAKAHDPEFPQAHHSTSNNLEDKGSPRLGGPTSAEDFVITMVVAILFSEVQQTHLGNLIIMDHK